MKKLLLSLFSVSFVGASAPQMVYSINTKINEKFDPIDRSYVSQEMIEEFDYLETIIQDDNLDIDINGIMQHLITAGLMCDEVFDSSFFYSLTTRISQVANKFKDKLILQEYGTKENSEETENFYEYIMKYTQEISVEFNLRQEPNIKKAFEEYEKYKSQEAYALFNYYDQKVTLLTGEMVGYQNDINVLNVKNSEITQKLTNIQNENKIIGDIIKIVQLSMGYIKEFKDIYDNAHNNVVDSYNDAQWHSDNWGFGAIPFVGIGFNFAFQNRMKDLVNNMNLFIKTFTNVPGEGNKWKELSNMQSSVENLMDEINAIDPNQDLIEGLLESAGLDSEKAGIASQVINKGIDAGKKAFPGYATVVDTLLSVVTAIFNAYKIHNEFENGLKNDYKTFNLEDEKVGKFTYDTYNLVNKTLSNLQNMLKGNNEESIILTKELQKNKFKIENIEKNLNTIKVKIKDSENLMKKVLNRYIFTDNIYYYYGNKIADINNVKTIDNRVIMPNEDEINKLKNSSYKKLMILLLENNDNNKFENTITLLKYKNENSNKIIDIIKEMKEI